MGPRCLLCGAGVQVYALSGRGLVGVDDGGTGVKGTRNVVAESGQRQSRMRGRWMRRRRWFAVVAVLALGAQCSVLGARRRCRKPTALDLPAKSPIMLPKTYQTRKLLPETFPLVLASRLAAVLTAASTCREHMTSPAQLRKFKLTV